MSDDPKKKFRKATEAIDLNLGGLLGNLGEVLGEAVQRLTEAGEASIDKLNETQSDKGPIRTHTGLRVRVGGLATKTGPKPVNPTRAQPAEPPPRALECVLIEDGDAWILTAEMPGVASEEVALATEAAVLTITTTGTRRYRGQATLPAACEVTAISSSLVNGILTLRGAAQ